MPIDSTKNQPVETRHVTPIEQEIVMAPKVQSELKPDPELEPNPVVKAKPKLKSKPATELKSEFKSQEIELTPDKNFNPEPNGVLPLSEDNNMILPEQTKDVSDDALELSIESQPVLEGDDDLIEMISTPKEDEFSEQKNENKIVPAEESHEENLLEFESGLHHVITEKSR